MKPVIHFSSMFGVDYELDIMPYWVEHWKAHKLDVYHIFLHREKGGIDPWIVDYFRDAGFGVTCIDGPHTDGFLRREVLGRYAMNMNPEHFLVTADADEFHCTGVLPYAPVDYHNILTNYDIVTGFLHDHYAEKIASCVRDPFIQYPFEEEFTGELMKNFTPPCLRHTEWPLTRRTKILACRAGEKLSYMGSHVMAEVSSNSKILDNQKVHHFAWRESASRKVAVKSYYKQENLREIFNAGSPVGLPVPEEYLKQHSDLVEMDHAVFNREMIPA